MPYDDPEATPDDHAPRAEAPARDRPRPTDHDDDAGEGQSAQGGSKQDEQKAKKRRPLLWLIFALVVIAFFYYFAIILLLGAELNSWLLGERETQGNLPELLHRLQQHGQITIDSEDKGVEHTHEDGETHTHPISDTDKYHKHPQSEEKEGNRIMNRLLPTKSTSRPPAVRQGALAYSDTGAVLDPKKPTFPVYMLGALAAAGLAYDMIRRRPAAPAKPNRTR